MKGSKSVKDRENILEKCEAVFCVSEFIKNKFLQGISIKTEKVKVLYRYTTLKRYPKHRLQIVHKKILNLKDITNLLIERNNTNSLAISWLYKYLMVVLYIWISQ